MIVVNMFLVEHGLFSENEPNYRSLYQIVGKVIAQCYKTAFTFIVS